MRNMPDFDFGAEVIITLRTTVNGADGDVLYTDAGALSFEDIEAIGEVNDAA